MSISGHYVSYAVSSAGRCAYSMKGRAHMCTQPIIPFMRADIPRVRFSIKLNNRVLYSKKKKQEFCFLNFPFYSFCSLNKKKKKINYIYFLFIHFLNIFCRNFSIYVRSLRQQCSYIYTSEYVGKLMSDIITIQYNQDFGVSSPT